MVRKLSHILNEVLKPIILYFLGRNCFRCHDINEPTKTDIFERGNRKIQESELQEKVLFNCYNCCFGRNCCSNMHNTGKNG